MSYFDSLEDDDFRNEATTYLGNDASLRMRATNRLQICLKLLSATPGVRTHFMKLDLHCQACFPEGLAGEHFICQLALHVMAKLWVSERFRNTCHSVRQGCTARSSVSAALRCCRCLSTPSSQLPLQRLDAHVHDENPTFRCVLFDVLPPCISSKRNPAR